MRRGFAVLLLALGCDPTSGFSDSAEAAAPSVKRYFDGAGTRVAEGPWDRVVVDLDPDTLYHVGARRLDDREPTFHLFGPDARDGCSVSPNSGTWLMGKPINAPYRVLPYLESSDESARGTLRFTTLDCEVQDVAVEDAGRPEPYLFDDGYLVPSGQGYTFVDPWQGTKREIATVLTDTLLWREQILLWADGKLKSFGEQLQPGHELGEGITSVVDIAFPIDDDAGQPEKQFLVEDAQGLHWVRFAPTALTLEPEDVLPGGCHLAYGTGLGEAKGGFAILELPCGSRASLVRLDERLEPIEQLELPAAASPEHTVLWTNLVINEQRRLENELVAIFYLTEVEQDRGTLWALAASAEEPVRLADDVDLSQVSRSAASEDWDGLAHANHQILGGVETYDWLRFRLNGDTQTIAERIVVNASTGDYLINFDGVAADLPTFEGDEVRVIARGVPIHAGAASSLVGANHVAQVDHFDGTTGSLFIAEPADFDTARSLGAAVSPDSLRFSWFMPALLFLEDWDAERQVGTLIAYNYELEARSELAEGVSSFDLTSYPWDGVIYSVPYGNEKGLWFSKAK